MSVQVPVELPLSGNYRSAIDDVNRWRGHCIERYARLEYEVTKTLTAMAAVPECSVTSAATFGAKWKRLRAAVEPGEAFGNRRIAKSLENFEVHFGRRNMLVHASGKIWIDEKGEWLWHYRFQSVAEGSQMQTGYFSRKEAVKIEDELAHAVQSLGGQLRALRQKLGVGEN